MPTFFCTWGKACPVKHLINRFSSSKVSTRPLQPFSISQISTFFTCSTVTLITMGRTEQKLPGRFCLYWEYAGRKCWLAHTVLLTCTAPRALFWGVSSSSQPTESMPQWLVSLLLVPGLVKHYNTKQHLQQPAGMPKAMPTFIFSNGKQWWLH